MTINWKVKLIYSNQYSKAGMMFLPFDGKKEVKVDICQPIFTINIVIAFIK
jgi:hypothetical protein